MRQSSESNPYPVGQPGIDMTVVTDSGNIKNRLVQISSHTMMRDSRSEQAVSRFQHDYINFQFEEEHKKCG